MRGVVKAQESVKKKQWATVKHLAFPQLNPANDLSSLLHTTLITFCFVILQYAFSFFCSSCIGRKGFGVCVCVLCQFGEDILGDINSSSIKFVLFYPKHDSGVFSKFLTCH